MAGKAGPYMNNDGLVFHFDTGNTVRSFKGEPTVNLLTAAEQDPRNWTTRPTADKTLLSETYLGLPVYRLQDADGVDPNTYVDNYQSVATETGLTEGDTYVFSFYFRVIQNNNIEDVVANNLAWVWYAGTTDYVYWNDYELNKWHKAEIQATVGSTYSQLLPRIDYDNSIVDICGLQFEKKSHATPYTPGTRSATQGLLDLTGNTSIDLSNVSFDSNAQMVFDGTDDRIALTPSLTYNTNALTIEYWAKLNIDGSRHIILANWTGYAVEVSPTLYPYITWWNGTAQLNTPQTLTLTEGKWGHVVSTWDGIDFKTYVNRQLSGTYNNSTITYGVYAREISATTFGGGAVNGQIASLKQYDRALTASEVQRNFNATRSRFGI
jgi:hypothetical protein